MTANGDTFDVAASFEPVDAEERELLGKYLARFEELHSSAYVQDGRCEFKLSWKQGGPLTGELVYPGEEAVRSFLSVLRHLYLQNEPTNFHRLLRLVLDKAATNEARELVKGYGRFVRDALKRSSISLNVGTGDQTIPVPPERILDDWLNGYYWHSDDDKRRRLDEWARWPPIHKYVFISTLNDLYRAYEALAIIVWSILEQHSLHK